LSTSIAITEPQESSKPIRVLVVTGIYPTEQLPHLGTFIKSQVDSLIAAGLEVEIIHPRPGPVLLRYTAATIQVFLKTFAGQYDVVHGHYGQWALIARLQWTTPTVISFLGTDLQGWTIPGSRPGKKEALITAISRWLCRRADAVIVKSEGMQKAAQATSTENIFVIPNGVDFELFRPIPRAEARAALGWDQDRYYILFGNDPKKEVKDFPLAQAAVERLHTGMVTTELVVAYGLPQTKLVQYINASNVLILSSVSEGSPNIVKEAMACNVPVVSTNVGDVHQVIGRTSGCGVCPRDPGALVAALEKALRHVEPTTGRTDIAHLDRAVVARQVIAVYEKVISKRRQRIRGYNLSALREHVHSDE
jgi:teichuronic acid biosynthesis glycosyltransferase TuaC